MTTEEIILKAKSEMFEIKIIRKTRPDGTIEETIYARIHRGMILDTRLIPQARFDIAWEKWLPIISVEE